MSKWSRTRIKEVAQRGGRLGRRRKMAVEGVRRKIWKSPKSRETFTPEKCRKIEKS